MAEIYVTSTADSGAGSLRQALADAQDGDVILFDPAIFPTGQTTVIYLSSYLTVNKSISIYCGSSDENGGYTSGATITRYVKREIDGVRTEVAVTDENPALEGETVLFHVVNRVALDGQAVQAENAADDWSGWSGTRIMSVRLESGENPSVVLSGITFRNALSTTGELAPCAHISSAVEYRASLIDCAFIDCINVSGVCAGVISRDQVRALISRCEFARLKSKTQGAAFESNNYSQNTFDGCTFDACTASSGGAVYSVSNSQNTFDGCTFDACTAANYGGAVYSYSNSQNTFDFECVVRNCEAPTGSGFYDVSLRWSDVENATFDNCEYVAYRSKDQQTTRYFTTTADSGDGSLRAILAASNQNDIVKPDPTVFPKGSTVTIKLASPLTWNKRLYLIGDGRRIVLDGQGQTRIVTITDSAYAATCEDVDFINGYDVSNNGAAVYMTGAPGLPLTRSNLVGAYGTRVIYASGSAGVKLIASVVTGNYGVTAFSGNASTLAVGSTLAGNYATTGAAVAASNTRLVGAINSATPSTAGFRVAPPDTLAETDFDKDLWKQWDLSLTPESSYATTTADDWDGADLWADGDDWRYDTLGLPRKSGGAAGAYERYDFDYYQGDTATSFASPTGWYTDRLLTSPVTTIDRGGSFFIDKTATLGGTLTTNATVTVALNADVVFSEYIQAHRLTLGIDASATFDLGATFTNVETSDKSDIQSAASFTVDVLDINGSSSFVFAPEDSTETATVNNAVYTRWGGVVTVTSSGYVSVPTDADLTFFVDLNDRVIRRGAGVTAITAEVVGSTLAPTITRTSDDGDVGLEYESAPNVWTYLGKAGTETTPITPETSVAVRAYDGEDFVYGVATRTYYYIGGAEGSFTTPRDWSLVRNGTALNVAPSVKGCRFIVGDISSGE